jgi:hypothetical protein
MKAYVDDILVKNMTYEGHLTDLEETFETMNKSNMKINSKKYFFRASRWQVFKIHCISQGIEIHPSSPRSYSRPETMTKKYRKDLV